ncbi:hypothetical protein G6F63_015884 [Rhizopus arrhizus]|nr:hypothetical protein G6F63_015884 [Rhizopus arrhizus]KAG1386933.1 hypothetical protein G6F58_013745 [Rhizopus delemar]
MPVATEHDGVALPACLQRLQQAFAGSGIAIPGVVPETLARRAAVQPQLRHQQLLHHHVPARAPCGGHRLREPRFLACTEHAHTRVQCGITAW